MKVCCVPCHLSGYATSPPTIPGSSLVCSSTPNVFAYTSVETSAVFLSWFVTGPYRVSVGYAREALRLLTQQFHRPGTAVELFSSPAATDAVDVAVACGFFKGSERPRMVVPGEDPTLVRHFASFPDLPAARA